MNYIQRTLQPIIQSLLNQGQNILLLGARQTGKTTLTSQFNLDLSLNMVDPELRLHYEQQPQRLQGEVSALAESLKRKPLILIDEIQKTPILLDVIQSIIDRKIAQFILTGSSARKLKRAHSINLLPGRVIQLQLDPLNILETNNINNFDLENFLLDGSLPGILLTPQTATRELLLRSYVAAYLEEEVRQEALVRQLGTFQHFLQLAAQQSGSIINLSKISQELGVSHTSINRYFEILEDCLIAERISSLEIARGKRQLVKLPKYLFFDLGVRRLAAKEGRTLPIEYLGKLFEQWIGMEILHLTRNRIENCKLYFWRDRNGIEVDWVVQKENHYYPIEVKWTQNPKSSDIKHLAIFLDEYNKISSKGYLICRVPRKIKLTEQIYALPWQMLAEVI